MNSPSDSATSTPPFVLREAGDLAIAIDLHAQFADPAGENALDMVSARGRVSTDDAWESR